MVIFALVEQLGNPLFYPDIWLYPMWVPVPSTKHSPPEWICEYQLRSAHVRNGKQQGISGRSPYWRSRLSRSASGTTFYRYSVIVIFKFYISPRESVHPYEFSQLFTVGLCTVCRYRQVPVPVFRIFVSTFFRWACAVPASFFVFFDIELIAIGSVR